MYIQLDQINQDVLYQGDILTDFPFVIVKDREFQYLKLEEDKFVRKNTEIGDEEYLLLKMSRRKVIILTQTCDIVHREYSLIAPIITVSRAIDQALIKPSQIDNIKRRKINYLFYLPAYGELEESIATLQTMQYIPKGLLMNYKSKKILTLSDWGRQHLSWTLMNFLGRPIEDKYS